MFVYEFECPKGHVVEDRVPMGTQTIPCRACVAETAVTYPHKTVLVTLATRILSPTPTTFHFADRRK